MNHPTYCLFLLALLSSYMSFSQLGGKQDLDTMNHTVNGGGVTDYYIYYPVNYDTNPDQPLLIALHGNAERGGDADQLITQDGEGSIAYLANEGQDFPFIVVSPHQKTNIGGTDYPSWNLDVVDQLIDHIITKLSINPQNVFLTGYSSGGGDAYRYLLEYPGKIKATAIIAGLSNWMPTYGYNLISEPYPCLLKDNIMRMWHGDADTVIPDNQTTNLVDRINKCDPSPAIPPAMDIIPGMDHDSIRGYVYSNTTEPDNLYDWLLQYVSSSDVIPPNDTTPPSFISPPAIETTTSSSNISFQLNEDGITYWALHPTTQSEITFEDITNGTNALDFGNTPNTTESITINGLSTNTTYHLYLISIDTVENQQPVPLELTFSTESMESGPEPGRSININVINSSSVSLTGWNNLNFTGISDEVTYQDLLDEDENATSLDITIYNGTRSSVINSVADNNNDLNNGILPDEVLRYAAYSSGAGIATLKDLDPTHYYTITLHGGRSGSDSRETEYTLNEQSQTLECVNNNSEVVVFDKLNASDSGEIELTFSGAGTWGYLNAIIIEEFTSLDAPDTIKPASPFSTGFIDNEIDALLYWSSATPFDAIKSFNLYASGDDQPENAELLLIGLTDTTVSVQDKSNFYFITEVDGNGNESDLSAPIFVTQNIPPPLPSPSPYVSNSSISQLTISWELLDTEDLLGYNIYRTEYTKPEDYTNFTPNSSTIINESVLLTGQYVDEGLSSETTYFYIVSAISTSNNESFSSIISGTTNSIPVSNTGITRKIQINISNSDNLDILNWNNANLSSFDSSITFNNLTDTASNSTSISFVAYNNTNGSVINDVADNGSSLNGGIYPDEVTRYAAYTSSNGYVSLNNLDNNKEYTIHILGGRAGSGSRVTRYTVNDNQSIDTESINNNSQLATFESIVPIDGQIDIIFQEQPQWGYLNAIVVEEYEPSIISNRSAPYTESLINEPTGKIQVYPNPTTDKVYIQLANTISSIKLFDFSGRKVLEKQLVNNKEAELSLRDLGDGIYTLFIDTSNGSITKYLIKTK